MNILHVNDIANVPWIFSGFQREIGLRCHALNRSPSSYDFKADFTISTNLPSREAIPEFVGSAHGHSMAKRDQRYVVSQIELLLKEYSRARSK